MKKFMFKDTCTFILLKIYWLNVYKTKNSNLKIHYGLQKRQINKDYMDNST